MNKIILLAFTSLFATTSFSMLQRRTAKSTTVQLEDSSPHCDLLTPKLISDVEKKQEERNDKVDKILKDYHKGIGDTLVRSTITAATAYALTRMLPVSCDYSVSSAAWAGVHVGILSQITYAANTLDRLKDLKSLPITGSNGITERDLVGVLFSIAVINFSSFRLVSVYSKSSTDINIAFISPTIYTLFIGLICASAMHDEINELATQIKSMLDSDPNSDSGSDSDHSPDDDCFCSIG